MLPGLSRGGCDGHHKKALRCRALPIRPKGRQTVPPRDAIRLELPGGGGFGNPRARDPSRVVEDVLGGMITAEQAQRDYGVVIDVHGQVDLAATERLRSR